MQAGMQKKKETVLKPAVRQNKEKVQPVVKEVLVKLLCSGRELSRIQRNL